MITTRFFKPTDAKKVATMIATTLRTSNCQDYSSDYLEALIAEMPPAFFIAKAQQTHFYVFESDGQIVGTGAIGSYWGKATEFSLFDIFALPSFQGRGLGRKIIETLEADDYFKQATRVEIPASITALGFYQHMGYTFKADHDTLDDEQLYRLEKFPTHLH
ncbi:GNAT family N-acetyltransferase [Levilactobacillus wangkuiensis]|uniref:GNAT family N-acetyltransferase n=1 Tax=Levilactobacillus wangkuiensis TaxID=2799566 RepID=UPI00194207E0|nr:GNAT family N-acetyltransferase [Levilactobacillus wangkuiensis]